MRTIKQKVEIRPGQIWREKRAIDSTGWKRKILVIGCAEGPAPSGKTTIRVTYEPHNYLRAQGKGRGPVSESCFRGDYELLMDAPSEAQKERRGEEG